MPEALSRFRWMCRRSLQRIDDLLDGRKDPEALWLRLHVRFCPHCKPWYNYERSLVDGLRRKASPELPAAARQQLLQTLQGAQSP